MDSNCWKDLMVGSREKFGIQHRLRGVVNEKEGRYVPPPSFPAEFSSDVLNQLKS